jgi:hypothetical protein
MATAKTWLLIVLGVLGFCVLSLLGIAGAGFYFVSHHIHLQQTTSTNAVRTFDSAREHFKSVQPLIEVDPFERPRETRALAEIPTSSIRPTNLNVLAWNPEDGKLVRVAVPFWVLRLGNDKLGFLREREGLNFDRLRLNAAELERIGPALVLDYRAPSGERVLLWTQ